VGVPAGQALGVKNRLNNGTGRLDFGINTAVYSNLTMSLAAQRTSTGFNANQLAYSSNGGLSFLNFGPPLNPPSAFDTSTFDFSTISALNNNPNVVIRFSFNGATTPTGNNRIDNVQFLSTASSGLTASPEPPGWLLGGVASLLLLARQLLGEIKRRLGRWEQVVRCEVSGVSEEKSSTFVTDTVSGIG
jgi:hypothetical protein